MKSFAKALVLGVVVLAPFGAQAEDAALLLVGDNYRRLPDTGGASEARGLGQMLTASGFRVVTAIDEDAEDAARAMEDFRVLAERADRVFVLVAGHVVSSAREAWLLAPYATRPTDITIGGNAVPLGPLFDIAAAHPGEAVLMVAPTDDAPDGAGLTTGFALVPPQGVTLVTGALDDVIDVARDVALVPGRSLAGVAQDVAVSGFVSSAMPFLPAPAGTAPEPAPTPDRESVFWDVVKGRGDRAAYEAYLDAFPNGRYAALARAALSEFATSADARAEAAEAALALDRDTRRGIQRDLSLLGFDPRGIDGIFGPGSRAAITAWQRANGHTDTGFLTADQVRAMADSAAIRAAELEREAAARKAEEEQRDTSYWRETGRGADEAGLRAYLARYPDGLFSDIAELRLTEIEADKRGAAAAEERVLWDRVRGNDTEASYSNYLRQYPTGTFADAARARLAELRSAANSSAAVADAKAEEGRVAGNGVTRLLIENRLAAAGFDPGAVDGTFDKETRRAIRRFQRARNIEVTGYVTQATMVRLLTVR